MSQGRGPLAPAAPAEAAPRRDTGTSEGQAETVPGSFRDPSGFVFTAGGVLYRQVNAVFGGAFDDFMASGLYAELVEAGLLIPHRDAGLAHAAAPNAHAVIAPERVDFVSYPYEWSFGQLRDAALATLDIQLRALARGFWLRDATAFNIQFRDGRPLLIDTLSFERYREGEPWVAYKQFCEHFLVPLLLVVERDVRCALLLREYLDGIPLDLGSKLLPRRTWMRPGPLLHVHLHARATKKYEHVEVTSVARTRTLAKRALVTLVEGLRDLVADLAWTPAGTEWADYVDHTNYSDGAHQAKRALVLDYVTRAGARTVWDVGGNTGVFSRVAREVAPSVVTMDYDPAAVEQNYRQVRARGETGLLPLLVNVMNPTPALGWAGEERMSVADRGPADVAMALALVHHIAISNNVPLPRVAAYLARLGRHVIIEWVPKSDSQVKRLLTNRPDIFPAYTQDGFESAFASAFAIEDRQRIGDSERHLYLLRARAEP